MKTEPDDPINAQKIKREGRSGAAYTQVYYGLTKREHFAALAMQGCLANSKMSGDGVKEIIAASLVHADALIQALNE